MEETPPDPCAYLRLGQAGELSPVVGGAEFPREFSHFQASSSLRSGGISRKRSICSRRTTGSTASMIGT